MLKSLSGILAKFYEDNSSNGPNKSDLFCDNRRVRKENYLGLTKKTLLKNRSKFTLQNLMNNSLREPLHECKTAK
jgi:hypothetical protein